MNSTTEKTINVYDLRVSDLESFSAEMLEKIISSNFTIDSRDLSKSEKETLLMREIFQADFRTTIKNSLNNDEFDYVAYFFGDTVTRKAFSLQDFSILEIDFDCPKIHGELEEFWDSRL